MTPTPVSMIRDKFYYSAPDELPAGFLEIIQPLAAWMMRELVTAYDNGYSTGRMDAARLDRLKAERRQGHSTPKS